jgi:hypothetical protein
VAFFAADNVRGHRRCAFARTSWRRKPLLFAYGVCWNVSEKSGMRQPERNTGDCDASTARIITPGMKNTRA